MPHQLRTECLRDAPVIAALSDQWDALADGVPFRRWDWLGAWWDAYGGSRELFVVAVFDEGNRLVGLTPLFREHTIAAGRKLQLLGSGKVCSDYMTLFCDPSLESEVMRATTDWLTEYCGDAELGWELLELENIPDEDARLRAWCQELQEAGNHVQSRPALSCWRISDLLDWEEYLARLSKSHRKRIRRALKRDLGSPQFAVHHGSDRESFERGWEIFVDLHQRRWRARDIDGCFSCEKFSTFLRTASERFLAKQRVDLCWLEDYGTPVAAQLDLLDDQGVFSYQSGLDPEITSYSPGHILQSEALHVATQRQAGRYDFLRGDEGYKAHWRAESWPCSTVRVTPNKALAKLRSSAWSTGQVVKSWIKASIGRDQTSA